MPNYGLDLPSIQDEEELLSQQNDVAADPGNGQFSIEAIEAENPMIVAAENTCEEDQSDYCRGSSPSDNSFKSLNHTMCKYCVSSKLQQFYLCNWYYIHKSKGN